MTGTRQFTLSAGALDQPSVMPPKFDAPSEKRITPGSFRLSIHPLTLAFRGDLAHLEKRFHHDYFKSNLKDLRLIHLVA